MRCRLLYNKELEEFANKVTKSKVANIPRYILTRNNRLELCIACCASIERVGYITYTSNKCV